MRRAAVRAFRTTCQNSVRGLFRTTGRSSLFLQSGPLARSRACYQPFLSERLRQLSTTSFLQRQQQRQPQQLLRSTAPSLQTRLPQQTQQVLPPAEPLRSSMYVRRLSMAVVSGLVGYGAYYTFNGEEAAAKQLGNQAASFSTKVPTPPVAAAAAPGTGTTTAGADAAAITRNVLVIGANELSTGTVIGDGPISKMTDGVGRRVLEMLTPEQATERLRKNEESYSINRGKGVLRYDLVQLASNDPIEDDHAEKIVVVPGRGEAEKENSSDWNFWGVFDGHSGWTTSAKLRQALISYVARELNDTYQAVSGEEPPPADAIEGAIKMGFTRLDDDIVNQSAAKVLGQKSKTVAAELLAPALSGSCALLSFYDSKSKLLRVACTGDSRAVLGRRSANGKWTATPLSVDQTGSNPDEAARLRQLHPGEEHVVRNGRVLGGLEPTRAFGDASYKWSREVSDRLRQSFFGRSPSPLMRTPPYVTAEPVVTTTKIEPEKGDFIVMATDGLWEMLTNEDAVGLVGKWIEAQAKAAASGKSAGSSNMEAAWAKVFGGGKSSGALPVEAPAAGSNQHGERTPIRLRQWGISPEDNERFLVKDKNAATHLVRNALGGNNEEQVNALLTLPAPFSRRYRDDLTVQVIFFGNGNTTGDVTVNEEATGAGSAIKPKL